MKYFVAILTFIVVFSFWLGMCLLNHYAGHGGFETGEALARTVYIGQYFGVVFGGLAVYLVFIVWPDKK